MIVLDGFDDPATRRGVLAIGNFDGVHRGHQKMLKVLAEQAKAHRAPAVVLTFDPPPVELLRPDAVPPRLTTLQTKCELLEKMGVDCLIVYPTDLALLNLEATEFFEQIVVDKLAARGLVEGPNFYFGKDRQGNVKLLAELCRSSGRELNVIEPEYEGEKLISSSTIRRLIAEGELNTAVKMLGHAYRLEGVVVPGEARGRGLGFPTANLSEIPTLIPGDGVYAGRVRLASQGLLAAVHVGPNPTFGEQHRKVEVHLLEFSGELYGQPLQVDLMQRIRSTQVFGSQDALKAQIESDLDQVRRLANRENDR
jgi:riboflavin kinase / FMN adenylyltransferase